MKNVQILIWTLLVIGMQLGCGLSRDDSQRVVRTRSEMIRVALAMKQFVILNEHGFADTNLNAKILFKLLCSTNTASVRLLTEESAWRDRGAILDQWESEIKVETQTASSNNLRLLSFGPNKIYDGGKGDDIIYDFNL